MGERIPLCRPPFLKGGTLSDIDGRSIDLWGTRGVYTHSTAFFFSGVPLDHPLLFAIDDESALLDGPNGSISKATRSTCQPEKNPSATSFFTPLLSCLQFTHGD